MKNIEVSAWAVAFLCLLFYIDPYGVFTPFLFAVSAHELGHLLLCKITGTRISAFRIGAAGAELQAQFSSYSAELLSTAAGPAINLLLSAAFIHIWFKFSLVNLFLAMYNLLPILPLDGGHILHMLLLRIFPFETAERLSCLIQWISLLVCVGWGVAATALYHYGLWPCLFAALLLLKTASPLMNENLLAKGKRRHYNNNTKEK